VPASRDGLGPFYRDVIAVDPLEPWDSPSAAYRLQVLARTLPFPVSGARLVPAVLDYGGDDRLSWSLTAALLRTLHSWPVPKELIPLPGSSRS
jgi:hypothetical protein